MRTNRKRIDVQRHHSRRRILWWSVGALVMVYFSFLLLFGERGLMKFLDVFRTHRHLAQEIHRLEEQNEKLRGAVQALKSDHETIERIARQELGLVKKGELIYQFESRSEP